MEEMEAQGAFQCLEGASHNLGALVRNLILDCKIEGKQREVSDALLQLSGYTHPDISAEAGAILDGLNDGQRAGRTSPEPQVSFTKNQWVPGDERGHAELLHGGGDVCGGGLP